MVRKTIIFHGGNGNQEGNYVYYEGNAAAADEGDNDNEAENYVNHDGHNDYDINGNGIYYGNILCGNCIS